MAASFCALGLLALNIWKFVWPPGHEEVPPVLPPAAPPPTRCLLLADPVSASEVISPGDASAFALWLLSLLLVGSFTFGSFLLMSRTDSVPRLAGVSGYWSFVSWFSFGHRSLTESSALPRPQASTDYVRIKRIRQMYHAKLRELEGKRQRQTAYSLHWIKKLAHARIALLREEKSRTAEQVTRADTANARADASDALYRDVLAALTKEQAALVECKGELDQVNSWYKGSLQTNEEAWRSHGQTKEQLVNSSQRVRELETLLVQANEAQETSEKDLRRLQGNLQRTKEELVSSQHFGRELGTLLSGTKQELTDLQVEYRQALKDNDKAHAERSAALRRAGAAEKRTSEVEAELRALRAAAEAKPTASSPEAHASADNLEAASVKNDPTDRHPAGAAAAPSKPTAALSPENSGEQASQGLPAATGRPSSEVDTTAGQEFTAKVGADAPQDGLCWATNTQPCRGDVAKGKPCVGDPDKYDAQHNLVYDWTAPDLYYGPYRASDRERETRQGSLARKKGLCVDCFNARSKVVPAKEPFGPREPANYLY